MADVLDLTLSGFRKRIETSEPRKLEDALLRWTRRSRARCDLGIELGDLDAAKDRLRTLRVQRKQLVRELAQSRVVLPTVDELMPRLREKLGDVEATLRADTARGRLALGGLSGEQRLRSAPTGGSKEALR